jgi:transposase
LTNLPEGASSESAHGPAGRRLGVEAFFHNLKRFRCLATRFEKTAKHYLALVHVACSLLWLREVLFLG